MAKKYTADELNDLSRQELILLVTSMQEQLEQLNANMERLIKHFGEGCYRKLPDESYKRLRYTPASWTVELHTVEVYVGTDGLRQDEFLRGDRPADLLRNSIVTPSLEAAILNGKYVNSIPLYRMEQEFQRNGVYISRQNMANWTILCAERYLKPVYDRLKEELFRYHVTQADETPVKVINDGRSAGSTSYMWVHRSGEYYKDRPVVLYEYQKTRHHRHPEEFYRGFKGILVTDGLAQYHLLEDHLEGLTNANCFAHARRDFSDAVKAIKDPELDRRGRSRSITPHRKEPSVHSVWERKTGCLLIPSKGQKQAP